MKIGYSINEGILYGWFDIDSAIQIARCGKERGKALLLTSKDNYIIKTWDTPQGDNIYRPFKGEWEIVEILLRGDYKGDDVHLNSLIKRYEL